MRGGTGKDFVILDFGLWRSNIFYRNKNRGAAIGCARQTECLRDRRSAHTLNVISLIWLPSNHHILYTWLASARSLSLSLCVLALTSRLLSAPRYLPLKVDIYASWCIQVTYHEYQRVRQWFRRIVQQKYIQTHSLEKYRESESQSNYVELRSQQDAYCLHVLEIEYMTMFNRG